MATLIAAVLGAIIGAIATGAVLFVLERKKESRHESKKRNAAVSIFSNEINLIVRLLENRFHELQKLIQTAGEDKKDILVLEWEFVEGSLKPIDDNLRGYLINNYDIFGEKLGESVWAFIRTGSVLFNDISYLSTKIETDKNLVLAFVHLFPRLSIVLRHGYKAIYDLASYKNPVDSYKDILDKIDYYSKQAKELNEELRRSTPPPT